MGSASKLSKPTRNQGEIKMTNRKNYDDLYEDLCPSDFRDPWPPSDEEIEERERQAEWEDLQRSIPDAAERNRNLK